MLLNILIFILLIFGSAFFSSAEISIMTLNRIKLQLQAKKKNKKALLLSKLLEKPEEFFSTILIGNNFVNIGAASISTVLFTRLLVSNEQLILLVSTLATTVIILFFGEILPKSYAFRYSEKISYFYVNPIKFFTYLFYPIVKFTTAVTNLFFKGARIQPEEKELSLEEVKHFLTSQTGLFRYNPGALRMLKEVLDIGEKDIKSIMVPRLHIIALEENAGLNDLKKILQREKITKIPVYKDNLDNITGIIHTDDIFSALINQTPGTAFTPPDLKKLIRLPIFISEYSSINYTLEQFKKFEMNMAVIVDEYGTTLGILTLTDIFREILGEIKLGESPIKKLGKNHYLINGSTPVEEVNEHLHLHLPENPYYTTMSGLFIYYFGKYPHEHNKIKIRDTHLAVSLMGKCKIEEIHLYNEEK